MARRLILLLNIVPDISYDCTIVHIARLALGPQICAKDRNSSPKRANRGIILPF
jgi:hypothetical protein